MSDKLMTIDELSEYLQKPVKTIRDWVYKKEIPYLKIGHSIRFDKKDIQSWLKNECRVA